jgi:hypothetical protein
MRTVLKIEENLYMGAKAHKRAKINLIFMARVFENNNF